jgi:hypothetical protein
MITTEQIDRKPLISAHTYCFGVSYFGMTVAFDRIIYSGRQVYRRVLTIGVRPVAELSYLRREVPIRESFALETEFCLWRFVFRLYDSDWR